MKSQPNSQWNSDKIDYKLTQNQWKLNEILAQIHLNSCSNDPILDQNGPHFE